MSLLVFVFLVFLATLGLSFSGLYFLVEAPAERQRKRTRLESLQQRSMHTAGDLESPLVREAVLSRVPALNRILLQVRPVIRLQLFLQRAATKMTAARLLLLSASLGSFVLACAFITGQPAILSLSMASLAAAIPFGWIAHKARRRAAKFEELFPDAIDMLARAVRAGHAFTTGLELIATELPDPVATEFRVTYDQQNLGLPLRDALANLCVRMPLPDVRVFVTALQIQRESGGNLGEILDNLAQVIRERFKILRQVQVYSAEARMTLYVLTAMPPVAGLGFWIVNPGYMAPLVTTPLGHRMILTAMVMQAIGYLIIRKIIRIKV
jgi:tight adherence protein B